MAKRFSLWGGLGVGLGLATLFLAIPAWAASYYVKQPSWCETVLASRVALARAGLAAAEEVEAARRIWFAVKEDYPIEWDWAMQDAGGQFDPWFRTAGVPDLDRRMMERVAADLGAPGRSFAAQAEQLVQAKVPSGDRRWLDLYVKACELRRRQRLRTVVAQAPRIIFVKHHTVRPSFFAYTEGLSDAQNERHFLPGSELCLLEVDGLEVRSLVKDPTGAIRDPAVSWDGQRVMFAWKKSLDNDDYHLYELDMRSNQIVQITSGLGYADYEPAYLPNDDIIFASTRCVQTVDCWWTEVSNLYTCDAKGRFLRRLGFDQVHSIHPEVTEDGRVIYTRWDYNDRGQIFTQALFQMNPDGTSQTEYYGNNSWFPTTMVHARGIPGTEKVMAVLCGHHTSQAGKLAVIDPSAGRQENSGVQLVAPVRPTPAERIDAYGQVGELWQYPYPLNENECLVTYAPLGWDHPPRRRDDAAFGIYWMDLQGHRELLAADASIPCCQPVPLAARPRPFARSNRAFHNLPTGTYYLQDIYVGPGLAGVPRGTVKKLRVVGLQYRAAGVGNNGSGGPGGAALVSTPISIGNGAWDVKNVLGEAKVYEDGSALFTVPARTPVYFQAVDARGCVVQTMRSWSTLQPGEYFGCVGCHDHKNTAPPTENYGFSLAMKAGPQALDPFYGPPRGFSFPKEIQPILDAHCVRCHHDRKPVQEFLAGISGVRVLQPSSPAAASGGGAKDEPAFSLSGDSNEDSSAKRKWSDAYLVLTGAQPDRREFAMQAFRGNPQGRVVNWLSSQSAPELQSPYSGGSARSALLPLLETGHKEVRLSQEELDKIACWIDLAVPYCGSYIEANAWTEAEMKRYERFAEKRRQMEVIDQESIRALLGLKDPSNPYRGGMGR